MFNRKKNKVKAKGMVPDAAPGDLALNPSIRHFELGANARIERNRWFLISMILALALIASTVSFTFLLPLKTVETFQVTKTDGGRLVVDSTPVGNWEPDSDSITYFLNRWANTVWDVNHATVDSMIRESSLYVIGNAAAQLSEFRARDNPLMSLGKTPNYNRSYEFLSINYVKNDVGLLRFRTITRAGDEVKQRVYLMTITFTRIKPKNMEQVVRNPAGIYITNFNVSEESEK